MATSSCIARTRSCATQKIRQALGLERWSVLGQSFGGFCVCTYLSIAPDGLHEAYVTGGLPLLERATDEVYRATYERVRERNRRFYARYPDDLERVRGCTLASATANCACPREIG